MNKKEKIRNEHPDLANMYEIDELIEQWLIDEYDLY